LRVAQELREAAESVLREGETLSSLIETSVRETIQRRRVQEEFIARGLRARDDAARTGSYHAADAVHSELQQRLDARRKSVLGGGERSGSCIRTLRERTCCGCSTSFSIDAGPQRISIPRSGRST
jgi:hypothetical protein